MSFLKSASVRIVFAVLLLSLGLGSAASAATSEFQILLNLDNQINTGCDVPTLTSGTFPGVEQILITTVDTTGSSAQVTALQMRTCTNPATDTFGPPTAVAPPPGHPLPWPVGISNGTGGTSVIETYFPLSLSSVTLGSTVRLGVLGSTGGILRDELLVTQPGGNGPIILQLAGVVEIPTLSEWGLIFLGLLLAAVAVALLRRRTAVALLVGILLLSGAGLAWAAACDLNGTTIGEWAGPLATEPSSDAPAGADIRAFFGFKDTGINALCFRIDALLVFNQPPVANDQNVATNEDTPVPITLTGSDADGNPLTFTIVTGPTHGTLSGVAPNVTYTPNPDYNGPDSFTFQVDDGQGGTDTGTVTITVNGADDPPTAVADAATVSEDSGANAVPVLANDTDPDAGPISIQSVTQPANGTVVITGGGTGLTYQPNANYCNSVSGVPDTFTYTLAPGGSTATVTMTVTCQNDAPVANDDMATLTEDDPATPIPVLANDTDVEGDSFTIQSVTQPANGVVVITGGGTGLTYQPNANYCNTPPGTTLDTFTYTLTPGGDSATVTVTVNCVNDDPVANDDAATVAEDSGATAVPVLTNDTDPESDPFTIQSVTQPANGTVVITGGGTGLTYAPNANYCNSVSGIPDTFTYTLTPGGDTATVTMTVTCVDDNPVAVADAATVAEDSGANAIPVLANDTDVDGGTISIQSVTQPANGTVVITGGGTGLTYAPNANYCNSVSGVPDTFTYTLTPGGSSTTVAVTVTCADDNPVAVPDAATVNEDSGANAIPVLANDTDMDGGPISIQSVTQPANGTVVITGGGTGLTYAPNANYCNSVSGTPDTFTYTLAPGGSSTTVTMTVTCVDDDPLAVPDAATVTEDSGANAIPVLANDTDPDGGPISIQSVTQPANGTVVITGGGTGLTYAPNANYCNSVSGVPDTFTYSLTPGGSTTTVTVTVTCVDDTPVAVNDAALVNEDSGPNAIPVLANDTDVDGGPISIQSVTQPANGTVVITGGGSGLTYQPNPNYCNTVSGVPDTFTYMLAPGVSTATVSVTVTCLNDAPVLDLDANDSQGTGGSNFAVTFTEGEAAKLIEDPLDATVTDIDSATLATLTVTITNLLDTGSETLSADVTGTSITANYVAATGVLTLTGPDTVANFQMVLRTVRYQNTDIDPDTTARVIQFVANDGTSNSNTATSTVTIVAVDTPPTAVADSATVAEDSTNNAINVLANDTNPDGGPQSIQSVTQPANGTVAITGGGTGVTYTPNANYCNSVSGTPDTFTYTLAPGGSTATVSVTVTCQDDNPVAVPDAATVAEDSGATAIPVLANDTDPDGGPISIQSVTQPANGAVVITGGGTGLTYAPNANYCNSVSGVPDTFTYTLTPGGSSTTVTVTVTCVDDNPVAVADAATVVEDSGATAIPVLANDTDVDGGTISIQSVTQPANGVVVITGGGTGLTYAPNANYCNSVSGTPDTFTYTLTPGGSTATVSVTVTCVDDPPVAVADAATVVEDSGANAINVLANDTDPDGGPKSIQSVTQPANGVVVITGGGTGLTYAPNANYCNSISGTPDTFTYTLTPGGSSTTVSITVTCVNDAPTLANTTITYTTPGNTQLHVAGATRPGVAAFTDSQSALAKSNPSDIDGPSTPSVVPNSGTTANGGSYTINADGSFTYVPPVGFTGTDSFTYQVTDGQTPVTGTISITVGQRVWYIRDVIDTNNPAGGDGRSTNAFDSIAAYNAATTNNGDIIFVFAGNTGTTPLTGGIVLKDGQKLHGEGIGLTVPGFGTLIPAGTKPRINNTAGDTVSVPATAGNRQNVEIRGLDLQGSGNAVDVTASGANSVSITISDNNVRGAGLEGIDLNAGSTGTFAATLNNNSLNATGNAFDARTTAGSGTLTIDFSNEAVLSNATGVLIDGSVGGGTRIIGFANNTVSQDTAGTGISITSATFDATPGGAYQTVSGGTTVVGVPGNGVGGTGIAMTNVAGDLAFTDLDIFADGGAGLRITGTGAVNTGAGTGTRVTVGAGVAIFEATGGPAVDVTNATVDLQPTSIKSTNSPTTGVSLVNVADGTTAAVFSAGSGSSITNATGTDFNLDGGNANVSYAGPINNSAGRSVSVTNRTADTAAFSGAITDTGTGIFLNSNTGSTISFSGVLSLTTGANDAFTATGGGTVTATDTANTITTTTGTALKVQNTVIGVLGLKFRSISANGGANGIVLSNTGSSGGLIVTGNGGTCTEGSSTCTGGWIRNMTGGDDSGATPVGTGIVLNNTANVSLTRMRINDTSNYGIRGTSVSGFTFANGIVDGANGTNVNTPFNEGSLVFFGVTGTSSGMTGTSSITNSTIMGGRQRNIAIDNSVGILNLTMSGDTIKRTSDAAGDDGFFLEADTTANVTLAITNNIFARHGGDHINVTMLNNAVVDLTITGNTLHGNYTGTPEGNHPIGLSQGIFILGATFNGTCTYEISNNGTVGVPFRGNRQVGAIHVNKGSGTGTFSGSIENNVIGDPAITGSGSSEAFGIIVGARGAGGSHTTLINNNQVRQYFDRGIVLEAGEGSAALNATVTNNTVSNFADAVNSLHGIHSDNGILATDTNPVCLQISGNSVATAGNEPQGGADIRLRRGSNTTVRLPGVAGPTNANATALLQANNPTATTITVTGNGFSSGAACPLP